jgi:hypothetical protein
MQVQQCFRTAALIAGLASLPLPASADVFTYGDFYEETASASCSDVYSCRVDFTKTPAGRILTLRRAACFVEHDVPLRLVSLGAANQLTGGSSRTIPLPFSVNTTGNGAYFYSINQEVLYLMRPSRFPFIIADTSARGDAFIECTITGTLSDK